MSGGDVIENHWFQGCRTGLKNGEPGYKVEENRLRTGLEGLGTGLEGLKHGLEDRGRTVLEEFRELV